MCITVFPIKMQANSVFKYFILGELRLLFAFVLLENSGKFFLA